jgi:hypothetical protein
MRRLLLAAAATLILAGASMPYASAQCLDCAKYPDRDHLNGGIPTPEAMERAAKQGVQLQGAPSANTANANAAVRGHRKRVQPQ